MQTATATKQPEGREAWLQERRKGIGGSDAAAILGLNPWRSPFQVYLEKIGEAPEYEPGEPAYWGTILEDIVAAEFTKRTGLKVQRVNKILWSSEHPFMLANIDRRIVGTHHGLEAKTTSAWNRDEWSAEAAPIQYVIQCQHYMAVTGWPLWHLAVLIGGQQYLGTTVERDESLIADIIQAEAAFWECVQTRTPPAVDGSDACTAALKALYPASTEESVILPDLAGEYIKGYHEAAAIEKRAKEAKQAHQNALEALMGNAGVAYLPGNPKPCITWKSTERKGYTAEPTTYRKFTVKGE